MAEWSVPPVQLSVLGLVRHMTQMEHVYLSWGLAGEGSVRPERPVVCVSAGNFGGNPETRETGYATFFSRTRGKLWTKGETSGNRLRVERLSIDCDDDTVLLQVTCEGDGVACHTGARSCFRPAEQS